MPNFKLAIFDLAGTTVRDPNTVASCLQRALQTVGVEATAVEVSSVMGIRKPIAIQRLLELRGAQGDVDAIHEHFRQLIMETYQTSPDVGEITGTAEVFRWLRDHGIRVAVDTGFDRQTVSVLLKRLNWGHLLDDSITSDEVANGRPHPDMVLELCRRSSIEPAQTIKVGDTPADLQEGKAAGVGLNVGVLYGTHSAADLEPFKPDALLSDIRELITLLDSLGLEQHSQPRP